MQNYPHPQCYAEFLTNIAAFNCIILHYCIDYMLMAAIIFLIYMNSICSNLMKKEMIMRMNRSLLFADGDSDLNMKELKLDANMVTIEPMHCIYSYMCVFDH